MQAADIIGECYEVPFTAHLVYAAQAEMAKAEYGFDDPEYRLDGLLAQAVFLAAVFGLEFFIHFLQPWGLWLSRRFVFLWRTEIIKAFATLRARCHQYIDALVLQLLNVYTISKAVVGQHL